MRAEESKTEMEIGVEVEVSMHTEEMWSLPAAVNTHEVDTI